ncbi:hypothetical protein E2C01_046831 [Portunus trituberculatus]|uniref:Uncharacterized protein n=1 Tax=Portunus trituberculatus TaxID=210409 RepID=A0A5B7FYT8_PORTR|nr:hypothetical protein [Portunus trituberculatus]
MTTYLNHEEFVGNPSIQELKEKIVTKDQLKYIAREFDISFTSDIRKDELIMLVLAHLGDDEESAFSQDNPSEDPNLALAVETFKLDALKVKLEIEKEQQQQSQRWLYSKPRDSVSMS